MFYIEDSLKRGGRFYLCWVADSWPLRFANITEKELWSQDIRKICADLLKLMSSESGRPIKRFSLRLSSQLLRGLVRFYNRKINVLLGNLCLIHATTVKNTNKKWLEPTPKVQHPRPIPLIRIEEPEEERNLEKQILASDNMVANIDDITLKEPIMDVNQFLLVDGFGELRNDLAHSYDKTIEMMMLADASVEQHSAIDLPTDFSAERSHDKSRLAPHDVAQMERMSEHDITVFRKSNISSDNLALGAERDIPEIPEIPHPDPNTPQPVVKEVQVPTVHEPKRVSSEARKRQKASEEIILEDLEAMPQVKRRRLHKMIVDKKIKLRSEYLRSRIDQLTLELRCKCVEDEVIQIRVPAPRYFTRPAHGGAGLHCKTSHTLRYLYTRNLDVFNRPPPADRRIEVVTRQPEAEPEVSHISIIQEDISEIPTQIVETMSQAKRDRELSEYVIPAKRILAENQKSVRSSEHLRIEEIFENNYEADKENIAFNLQTLPSGSYADMMATHRGSAPAPPEGETVTEIARPAQSKAATDTNDELSETPLGSLDRTKVSLGDSDNTTESMKLIRHEWGSEGTMSKILKTIRLGVKPLDLNVLISTWLVAPQNLKMSMARCFASLIKLKHHGFVNLRKNPNSSEIADITLGRRFPH